MAKAHLRRPAPASPITGAVCLMFCVLAFWPVGVAHAETGTVNADGLRVRDEPWGAVTDSLSSETMVRINARTFDQQGEIWYYVTTGWGGLGWVYADFVDPARDAKGRVGIQAGHWRYEEADYPLNTEPGTSAQGITERETNLNIALVLARRLSVRGVAVDLLPAAIPAGYRADAVVAIHADAGPSDVRGFFAERPRRSPVAVQEAALAEGLIQSMIWWTGIPYVPRSTADSRNYYGFRAVDPQTPIVLVETGCLTNAADRAIIAGNPGLVADALVGPIAAFVLP